MQKEPYITIFTVRRPCEARVPQVKIDVDFGSRIKIATTQQSHQTKNVVYRILVTAGYGGNGWQRKSNSIKSPDCSASGSQSILQCLHLLIDCCQIFHDVAQHSVSVNSSQSVGTNSYYSIRLSCITQETIQQKKAP